MAVEWGQYAQAFKAIHDALLSSLVSPPEGKRITKVGIWKDGTGKIKYMKYYDGDELLFTLEFSNAGAAGSETWNITRTDS